MADKVSSHSRFLKKSAHDLKQLYDDGEYVAYIERFMRYVNHAEPELELVEKYYESRLRTHGADSIVDDALMAMNAGTGDYETHMYYMLTALLELERYFEVIEFSDHLMGETIPQGFRIEVAAIRHRAKKALDEKQQIQKIEAQPEVSAGHFEDILHYEKLEKLSEWTGERNEKYVSMIREMLPKTKNYQLITFMLLYLREMAENRPVEIKKFEKKAMVIPAELDTLEELDLSKIVLSSVIGEMEERMPEFLESAREMVMSHIIHCYPLTPAINTDNLIDSYLLILHEMVNLEYERASYAEDTAIEWIRSMESSIADGN